MSREAHARAGNWTAAVAFLLITIIGVVGIATCQDPPTAAAAAGSGGGGGRGERGGDGDGGDAAADDDGLSLVSSSTPSPPSNQTVCGMSPRTSNP